MPHLITSLSHCDLSPTSFRRDLLPGLIAEPEDVEKNYDTTTFWYDAFWRAGRLFLIAPTPLNLDILFSRKHIFVDGRPASRIKRKIRDRHAIYSMPAKTKPRNVSVHINDQIISCAVNSTQEAELFDGKNACLLISKDNNLDWISDYVSYHKNVHGLQSVLFFDNGSTQYSLQDLSETIAKTGVENSLVIDAPFPFGVRNGRKNDGRKNFRSNFLQDAMLNLGRLRFLHNARAVLNSDIDELIWTSDGRSIFDHAVGHWSGISRFSGTWRHIASSAENANHQVRHADHLYAQEPEASCVGKYCVRPKSITGLQSWNVHTIGHKSRFLKNLGNDTEAGFWHFRHISTSWKYDRNTPLNIAKQRDRVMEKMLIDGGILPQTKRAVCDEA
ncbi:hypothetical protein [Celeribacter halophilus]|uniref:hypothetical protein n=1 Tax=Celeribacter halophilus TaxID=576117 RepID=UPI003A9596F1